MKELYGLKVGTTRVFDEDGTMVPVTVIRVEPQIVLDVKTGPRDGYDAAKIGFGQVRKKLVNKPDAGQFKKAGIEPKRYARELTIGPGEEIKIGQEITVKLLSAGDKVHITGISKGLGFQGTVRRHGFRGGPKTHGQSDRLRAPGSIGASSYPSRVYKGQRMAGHMGNARVTMKNLTVKSVEAEQNLVLIRGAVPGKPGGLLKIVKA